MEDPKKMESKCGNFNDVKGDDDVSVIAVIRKENDRSSRQNEKSNVKQEDRRVFELSDERSKMALRKQLELDELSTEQDNAEDRDGMEVLRKLPPGTIVVKQEKKYKEDSDYVRDSTGTSSGGSTSGSGVTKIKKVHRATRRNRGTAEVRRNPIRVTKKNLDKDFSRPRQRLLSTKRKEMLFDSEPTKRGKSSTMPYMNTRSVTRKMYNVGATYQAPTLRDETEWKEWPVHGMHERPVFHPQVGLAAEYLGRYFTSLDGLSYREIIDRPEIEVVSVDPHCDYLSSSTEKKRNKKAKPNKGTFNPKSAKVTRLESTEKSKSFESCMHESFHCVLGYCSQVMTPTYKTNVEGKINMLNDSKNSFSNSKEMEKPPSVANIEQSNKNEPSVSFKENLEKSIEENKFSNNYTVAMFPQNVKSFAQIPKTRLFPAQKVYIANSQKSIAFTNLKTFQGGQMKFQEVVRSSKNPFFLVNPPDMKETQLLKPVTGNVNLNKAEEPSASKETLGELTSIYKNVSNEELSVKQTTAKRGNKVEFNVTKYLLDSIKHNKLQVGKESNSNEKKLCYGVSGKESNTKTVSGGLNKTWCAGETSEIAKILSEYNKSTPKKPATENQSFCATMKNVRIKELSNKEENVKQSAQESSAERNVNITFPQGKWRRFHLTVEKLKDMKSNSNEKRHSLGIQNRQSLFKIDQPTREILADRKIEIPKQSKPVQRGQSNVINLGKKESAPTVNTSIDTTIIKTESLQELLENTAMLYCAATGTHQDDLASYVDNLDSAQSIQWLETCDNLIV